MRDQKAVLRQTRRHAKYFIMAHKPRPGVEGECVLCTDTQVARCGQMLWSNVYGICHFPKWHMPFLKMAYAISQNGICHFSKMAYAIFQYAITPKWHMPFSNMPLLQNGIRHFPICHYSKMAYAISPKCHMPFWRNGICHFGVMAYWKMARI